MKERRLSADQANALVNGVIPDGIESVSHKMVSAGHYDSYFDRNYEMWEALIKFPEDPWSYRFLYDKPSLVYACTIPLKRS